MDIQDAWIAKAKQGDLEAFGRLVQRHQAWLRASLRAKLRDWTAADDLAQDAFVTAYRKIESYRGEGEFEAWLQGIAQNHFRNYIRKRREDYIGGDVELQALLGGNEEVVCSNRKLEALRECLGKVKGPIRNLLEMRYVEGKTIREISEETANGHSTLTMKLHRVRAQLAECINLESGKM
ncbi:sigma-70 family RNA polymerase sigma factor [Rubritalea tangerina]|uniref:RNA polymerase sigma factor n=2 Tax=Rubritalea tangerina TaxID=430798 RepID=A0ABW4ZG55_9BACT